LVPFALLAGVVSNARVVALSNSVMVVMASAGMVAHLMSAKTSEMAYTYGLVNVAVVPLVVVGAILCAPVGRRINRALSVERRRVVMGSLLIVMAARLAFRALG